jgi:hypothetical protein
MRTSVESSEYLMAVETDDQLMVMGLAEQSAE